MKKCSQFACLSQDLLKAVYVCKKKRWREKHIHFFPHDESKEFRYTRHVEHPISFLEGEQKIVKPSPLMNAPVFD